MSRNSKKNEVSTMDIVTQDSININNKERIIYLSEDIDNISVGTINAAILNINNEDDKAEFTHWSEQQYLYNANNKSSSFKINKSVIPYIRKPIKIYVNSYGGSIYDMWSLIDIIQKSKTPIHT